MVDDNGNPVTRPVSDEEIFKRPELHRKAVMKDFYKTRNFCGACPQSGFAKIVERIQMAARLSVYDEWQQSSWSKQSPLPFYKKDKSIRVRNATMVKTDARAIMAQKTARLLRIAGGRQYRDNRILWLQRPDAESRLLVRTICST